MPPPVTGKELRRWTKQIRSLERADDTDAVWASARELAERYAESAEARVVLGEMYIHLGETERAAAEFHDAWGLAHRTRKWKVVRRVARGLGAAGRDQEALELLRPLDAVMAAGPLGVERALLLRRLGRPADAVAELARTVEEDPHCAPALGRAAGPAGCVGPTRRARRRPPPARRGAPHALDDGGGGDDRDGVSGHGSVRRQLRLPRRQGQGPLLRAVPERTSGTGDRRRRLPAAPREPAAARGAEPAEPEADAGQRRRHPPPGGLSPSARPAEDRHRQLRRARA